MRSAQLRQHNLSTILTTLLGADAPMSRAELATQTRLTKPTVSSLVDDMIRAGLVSEGSPVSTGAGRPSVPLRPASGTLLGIGVTISAEQIACLALDLRGETLAMTEQPLRVGERTPAEVVDVIATLVSQIIETHPDVPVSSVCVAVPGRLSPGGDRVLSAPNLGWTDLPLKELLTSTPVLRTREITILNDNQLAVRTALDLHRGESFLYVRGGTGIGGAVVINGAVLSGDHGWAGEIGHTVIVQDGAPCRCGRRGCLEAYISRYALARRTGLDHDVSLDDLLAELEQERSRHEIIELIGRPLGIAIANALNVLDLSTVVLSGYLAPIADELTPVVRRTVEHHALAAEAGDIRLVRADGVERPVLVGACRAALEPVLRRPDRWITALDTP